MSEMPSREEFERYKSLRDKGDYRAAAKVLLPYKDNPKVRALIQQLKVANESGKLPPSKPSSKSSTKVKRKPNILKWTGIAVVSVVGICALLYGVLMVWYEVSGISDSTKAILMKSSLRGICFEVYRDDYEVNDPFFDACAEEVESAMVFYSDEVEHCYDNSENGNLEVQFMRCLVDNGFQFSGVYMLGLERR